MTLEISLNSLHFFVFTLEVNVAKVKIFLKPCGLLTVFIDLGLKFSLGPRDLSFQSLSDLSLLLGQSLDFSVSVLDDLLQLMDLPIEEFSLIGVSIFEEGKF